jgi:hypothetical protein
MGTRRVIVGVAIAAVTAIAMVPSPAGAGVFAGFEVAQGAGAFFANGGQFADVFGFSGVGVFLPGPPVNTMFACAAVGPAFEGGPIVVIAQEHGHGGGGNLVDFGCGEVEVTVDLLLRSATIQGTIPSELFDLDTFEPAGPSSIAVDVSWTGTGLPAPEVAVDPFIVVGGFPVPFGFADVFAFAGLVRDADASGSVVSATIGGPSGDADGAAVFEGASGFVGAFV